METNIEIEKLSAYAKTLQRTADHLLDNLERQMLQDVENMAGSAATARRTPDCCGSPSPPFASVTVIR